MYLETLKERTRIELVYDAVVALKNIEQERPIRPADIAERYDEVAVRAAEEQRKIMSQEAALAQVPALRAASLFLVPSSGLASQMGAPDGL